MPPNLYGFLGKEKSVLLAEAMLNIPENENAVWIHEKALYNVIGIKRGAMYGRRDVMTYLLNGIKKGHFGNKRGKEGHVLLGYRISLQENEPNKYNVACQHHGDNEKFDKGLHQTGEPSNSRPRWYRKGVALTDVSTQIKVVNALIGNQKSLAVEVASHRQTNYKAFVQNDGTDDTGYVRNDVMSIIREYEVELKIRCGTNGRYDPEDLERVKDVLRLMIVASNKAGKLEVRNGQLVPSKSLRAARGDTEKATTQQPAAVTPAVKKRAAEEKPTPDAIFTPPKTDGALKLESIRSTKDGYINFQKVDELSSLELLFQLYTTNSKLVEAEEAMEKAIEQMSELKVNLPKTFDVKSLASMSSQEINASNQNIQKAIQEAIDCLQGHFVPRKDTQLYKWIADSHAYTSGCAVQTPNNFEQGTYNTHQTSMTLESAWILRHIMYTHHLPVRKVLMLWAEFHVLILRTPVNPEWFVCERTLWYHVHRLHHIDNALLTSSFADSICKRTENGFLRYFYSSSDDSKHFNRNRHVCLISQLINDHPGFRHITSSVNEVKSDNAGKNSEAIIDVVGLRNAAHYGGGCNDNAADAQNEIGVTFRKIMDEVRALDEGNDIRQLSYENGVERRPIKYGDPYHISNLAVSHASEAAFGGTEHGDHCQVHHCQLLQSIHDLHSQ